MEKRVKKKQKHKNSSTKPANPPVEVTEDISIVVYGLTSADDEETFYESFSKALPEYYTLLEDGKNAWMLMYGKPLSNAEVIQEMINRDVVLTVEDREVYPIRKVTHAYSPIPSQNNFTGNSLMGKHCHQVTEVYPNVFLSDRWSLEELIDKHVTVLVPLASSPYDCWNLGFRGKIRAWPIEDFEVLPSDVLSMCIKELTSLLNNGEKIAIFCEGGHGRTGYIASCLVGTLDPDIDDPIKFVRDNYCKHAVESSNQIESIAEFLGKPYLNEIKASRTAYNLGKSLASSYPPYSMSYVNEKCISCDFYNAETSKCLYDYTYTNGNRWACSGYIPVKSQKAVEEVSSENICKHCRENTYGYCHIWDANINNDLATCSKFKKEA